MMASMQVPQNFPHPGGMQHPGVPPGHHMAPGMAHNPSQPGSQPGIPHHLAHQMAVSGAGGQVNPALMGAGMPPGANAHAMQHLNPNVQHMFPQQPVTQMNCEWPRARRASPLPLSFLPPSDCVWADLNYLRCSRTTTHATTAPPGTATAAEADDGAADVW